jgi:CheY-like chemotaxis protein
MQINAVTHRQMASKSMGAARPLEGRRLLVVEDDLLIGEALCEVLRSAGAVPIGPVVSPEAAIEAVRKLPVDGVLLDVKLQGVNGSTVAEYLRVRSVPFLLVTGYPPEALPSQLRQAPYLAKPALPCELVQAAAVLFGGH